MTSTPCAFSKSSAEMGVPELQPFWVLAQVTVVLVGRAGSASVEAELALPAKEEPGDLQGDATKHAGKHRA